MERIQRVVWGTYLIEGIEADVTVCMGNRALVRLERTIDRERAELIAEQIESVFGWQVLVAC